MASDDELIAFALRRLAEESEDHRPKMAARMREIAKRYSSGATTDPARQRVIDAAIAYCLGTNPDQHDLDQELRAAVGELTRA